MIVYYPKSSIMLRRDTSTASYEQTVLSVNPNTVLYMDTGSGLNAISASTIYITASWVQTASIALTASSVSGGVGGLNGMTYFTASATSYNWSIPIGIKKIRVLAIGGGGGGGNNADSFIKDTSAGYCEGVIDVTGLTAINVRAGLGGPAGGTSPGTNGTSSACFSITASGGVGAGNTIVDAMTGSGGTIRYSPAGTFASVGAGYSYVPPFNIAANIDGGAGRGGSNASTAGNAGAILFYY